METEQTKKVKMNKKELNDKMIYDELVDTFKKITNDEMIVIISSKLLNEIQAKDKHFFMAKNQGYVGGILYLAYIKANNPHTLDEISIMTDVNKRYIGKAIRKIKRCLGMKYCQKQSIMGTSCITIRKPQDYLERLGNNLELSKKTISEAEKILNNLLQKEVKYACKNPVAMCGSALYISALLNNEKKTQRVLADTCGVTEVTIRIIYKSIIKDINLEKKIEDLEKKMLEQKEKEKEEIMLIKNKKIEEREKRDKLYWEKKERKRIKKEKAIEFQKAEMERKAKRYQKFY